MFVTDVASTRDPVHRCPTASAPIPRYWKDGWVAVPDDELVDVVVKVVGVVVCTWVCPIPISWTSWVEGSASSVKVSVAVASPAAVGVNLTSTTQCVLLATLDPAH
jgi:hypothetical protein